MFVGCMELAWSLQYAVRSLDAFEWRKVKENNVAN